MGKKLNVLVVDDSALMRKVITDIINVQPNMQVAGIARNGLDALNKIAALQPDVVTMDVEMPIMDGLAAVEKIMQEHPVPVIMVSSLTKSGTEHTVRALQLGAVDFVTKPGSSNFNDIDAFKNNIVEKIIIAAGSRNNLQNSYTIEHIKGKKVISDHKATNNLGRLNKLILIGTSTGGPKALYEVIPRFPADLDAAVLVVQHMPPGFTKSLAERLDSLSRVRVKEAEQGEPVLPGWAYIAPGDYHMIFRAREKRELFINLTQSERRGGLRPSVDEMLFSIADQFWSSMVCVIMTGMGQDGAAGLPGIKSKGAKIIAQDESSCIVYGMPRAAVETGLVDKVVPLENIAAEVMKLL